MCVDSNANIYYHYLVFNHLFSYLVDIVYHLDAGASFNLFLSGNDLGQ